MTSRFFGEVVHLVLEQNYPKDCVSRESVSVCCRGHHTDLHAKSCTNYHFEVIARVELADTCQKCSAKVSLTKVL